MTKTGRRLFPISSKVILMFATVIAGTTAAHAKVVSVEALPPASIPEVLYHWTSHHGLQTLASLPTVRGEMPMTEFTDEEWLSNEMPEYLLKPGFFAWTHPVAGIGTALNEIYGGEELVKVHIARNNVRAVKIISADDRKNPDHVTSPVDIKGANLLLHIAQNKKGVEQFREWVILDPQIVDHFTANPADLASEIAPQLKNLEDPKFQYPLEDVHDKSEHIAKTGLFFAGHGREKIISLLRKFLAPSHIVYVPQLYMDHLSGQPYQVDARTVAGFMAVLAGKDQNLSSVAALRMTEAKGFDEPTVVQLHTLALRTDYVGVNALKVLISIKRATGTEETALIHLAAAGKIEFDVVKQTFVTAPSTPEAQIAIVQLLFSDEADQRYEACQLLSSFPIPLAPQVLQALQTGFSGPITQSLFFSAYLLQDSGQSTPESETALRAGIQAGLAPSAESLATTLKSHPFKYGN